MKKVSTQKYQVYINKTNIGFVEFEGVRAKEIVSFVYSDAFLNSSDFFNIEPDLFKTRERQYPTKGALFGFLEDCSPDRWGKKILRYKLKRTPKASESIFLIADNLRMGAIRFFDEKQNIFLAENGEIPLYIHINELLDESCRLNDNIIDKAFQGRLDGSLGGARPKAVLKEQGVLKLVKFPSKDDEIDVEAWEATLLKLANLVDINAPKIKLLKTKASKHSILLIDRFDRVLDQRICYLSAMSSLNYCDGDTDDASYIELADFIAREGDLEDAQELWKRMVFNVIVHNKDDHLRNHGFLRIDNKWKLSPVFDLNPNTDKIEHELSIDGFESPSLDLAIDYSDFFHIDTKYAENYIKNTRQIIENNIEKIALNFKIPQKEVNTMLESLNINKSKKTKKMGI